MENFLVNYMIPLAYILIGACVLGIVVGFIIGCVQSPKILIRSVIFVIIAVGIFGISFALSDSNTFANVKAGAVTKETVKTVGAILTMAYVMISLGVLGIIVNWFTSFIK